MAKSAVRSKPKAPAGAKRTAAKPTVKKKATAKKAPVKAEATSKTKAKPSIQKAKPKAKSKAKAPSGKKSLKRSSAKPKAPAKKPVVKAKPKPKPKPKSAAKTKSGAATAAKTAAKPTAKPAKSTAKPAKSTAKPKAKVTPKSKAGASGGAPEAPVVVERKPLPPRPKPKPEIIRKAKRVNFDAKTLKSIKADLGQQRVDLSQQLKDIEEATFNSTQSEMSGETGYDEDSADAGTATFEREKDLSIANNIQDLIDKIDKALQKIDDGTYGLCESCGDPISAERLKALPYVLLCIRCKKAEERR